MDLWKLDATETAARVAAREISAGEVVEAHLARIDDVNPHVNAIVRDASDEARATAASVDQGKTTGSLAGAVFTSKINTDHVGYPTDNGIKALAGNIGTVNHPVVRGLLNEGLAMVGRTNSPAFAMRFHTQNDLHGETLNPHSRDVSCGGSSGGAGVAVATGMCHVAQGNDVAGSVRWPATLNGVLGLRPTIGRMPTGGTNPAAPRGWSAANMSTQGPLARTMRDLRAAYRAMATGDWNEPFWVPAPHQFPSDGSRIKVALVTSDGDDIDTNVVDAVRRVGDALADAGYEVNEAVPPMTDTFFSMWERVGTLDISLGLAPMLPGIDDSGLTASITDWVSTLPPPTPQTFMAALNDRDLLMRAWNVFLAEYPLIITPMMAKASIARAFDVSYKGAMAELLHHGRWGVNLSAIALPALAFPAGHVDGVPIGVQMVAHQWREDILLDAGDALEQRFGVIDPVDVAWAGR